MDKKNFGASRSKVNPMARTKTLPKVSSSMAAPKKTGMGLAKGIMGMMASPKAGYKDGGMSAPKKGKK